MQAIVRTHYGPPDVLELQDIAKPEPKDGEARIRVHAASLNPLDWHFMRGTPVFIRLMGLGLLKPKDHTLGADIAGRVEAMGKGVTRLKVGDEVFGSTRGGFAEYACAGETKLALKPTAMTFEQAACIPIAGLTALQGLRDHGKVRAGQRVLIDGASGGVGTFAVQIAKSMGAHVTGVCSGRNIEMVRSIGADEVIDYTKEEFWRSGKKYDLILDNVAARSVLKPLSALTPTGIYLGIGFSARYFVQHLVLQPLYSQKSGRRIMGMLAKVNGADLARLAKLFESGKLTPVIDRRYPLRETPAAIRYLEEGHARGKVVIVIHQE